jgi:hypothetical protein
MTSTLYEGEWSASRPGRFTLGEGTSGTHWMVAPRDACGVEIDIIPLQSVTIPTEIYRFLFIILYTKRKKVYYFRNAFYSQVTAPKGMDPFSMKCGLVELANDYKPNLNWFTSKVIMH